MSSFDTSTFVKHVRVPVDRLAPVLRYWQQVGALQLLFVFLVLVVTGTALLSIPAASEVSSSLGQRFFTAVSAVTTTGSSPLPIDRTWSFVGEGILAFLVLIGGFLYMAAASFVLWIFGQRFGFRDVEMKRLYIGRPSSVEVIQFFRTVLLITLSLQALGAGLFFVGFLLDGSSVTTSLWWGPFHAITSFNNAGFTLHSEGFSAFRDSPFLLAISGLLAFCGAIGPIPLSFLFLWRRYRKIPLDSKIIFFGMLATVVIGMLLLSLSEWNNPQTLGVVDGWKRPLFAAFESSMRNVGYSVFSTESLRAESQLVYTGLMAIGGGAGSAVGGLKIGLIFVLGVSVFATLRGRSNFTLGRLSLSDDLRRQALVITFIFIVVVVIFTSLLLYFTEYSLLDALFEAISALTLSGFLSGGFLSQSESDVVLSIAMLMGRFLPLLLVIEMSRPRLRARYQHPEDSVLFG